MASGKIILSATHLWGNHISRIVKKLKEEDSPGKPKQQQFADDPYSSTQRSAKGTNPLSSDRPFLWFVEGLIWNNLISNLLLF